MILNDIWKIKDENKMVIEIDNYISNKCDYGNNFSVLTDVEKIFYLCQTFEREINNGGFDQFYFNPSGNNYHITPIALEAIGAKHTAKILTDATESFGCELPQNHGERQELLEELSTDELDELLDSFNNKFYEYIDDLTALNYKYLIRHMQYFT